jgi:hypothetical protein
MAQKLPAAVAAKYEIVGWTGGRRQFFGARFGLVDLDTITIEQADALARKGFKKIKLLETPVMKQAKEPADLAKVEK